MRKNEKENISIILMFGLLTLFGVLAYMFIKGDFKVISIRQIDANSTNLFVNGFINAADSKYGDKFVEDKIIEGKNILFVTSRWCGICNALKTTLYNEFTENAQENINLVEVDLNINTKTTTKYNITDVPTVIFIEDGELIKKYEDIKIDEIPIIVTEVLGK
jgi:thiol-disulfide isomerase/thioredoxin